MAETLFIGDESDVRASVERVVDRGSVLFIERKFWHTPQPVVSRRLEEYAYICRKSLCFFVVRSNMKVEMKERNISGSTMWEFDFTSNKGWIILETGGRSEYRGEKSWAVGRIRALLASDDERAFYQSFKRAWMKGYKMGKDKIKMGPSAHATLASELIEVR